MRIACRTCAAVAAVLAAATLAACAGLPDQSFGAGGLRQLPPASGPLSVRALANGQIMAATAPSRTSPSQPARNYVFRLNSNGTTDRTYAAGGTLSLSRGIVTVAPDGRVFLLDVTAGRLSAFTAGGVADKSFSGGSIGVPDALLSPVMVAPTGALYVNTCPPRPDAISRFCHISRYTRTGQLDTGFSFTYVGVPGDASAVVAFGPGDSVFVSTLDVRQRPLRYWLGKFTNTGWRDMSFGSFGTLALPANVVATGVAVDRAGGVAMEVEIRDALSLAPVTPLVFRFTANGTPDAAFGWHGMTSLPRHGAWGGPIAIDPSGRVLATSMNPPVNPRGSDFSQPLLLYRYLPNGQLDATFGVGGIATIAGVNGAQLSAPSIVNVTTDAADRPLLGLSIGSSVPQTSAIVRLTGR